MRKDNTHQHSDGKDVRIIQQKFQTLIIKMPQRTVVNTPEIIKNRVSKKKKERKKEESYKEPNGNLRT